MGSHVPEVVHSPCHSLVVEDRSLRHSLVLHPEYLGSHAGRQGPGNAADLGIDSVVDLDIRIAAAVDMEAAVHGIDSDSVVVEVVGVAAGSVELGVLTARIR